MSEEIKKLSLIELKEKIHTQEISSVEVVSFFLKQIEKHNETINAFISVNPEALKEAHKADEKIKLGQIQPLTGVPIAVKDLFCTKGLLTTAASKMLKNFIPPYSSTAVRNLEEKGAIVLGKTNLDEFAMGSSTETSFFGPCKNPWNLNHIPGGSSGGSAAAVSGGLSPGAIGTDTGGSIRQPSAYCGLVGIKPTYGRISRYGIIAFASSLDQAGSMAKTVKDAAFLCEAMAGEDSCDSTTSSEKIPPWLLQINPQMKGLKVGRVKEWENLKISSDTSKTLENAFLTLKKEGAQIKDISLPLSHLATAAYYLVATSEASSNLARYDGVGFGHRSQFKTSPKSLFEFYSKNRGEGFGTEVKRRIILGTYSLSSGYYDAYYNKACQIRRMITEDFLKAFKEVDVILSPVTSSCAFLLGEKIKNPLKMYSNDIFTPLINLAGLPAMSVPFGYSTKGLPLGVQLVAAHFNEQMLFNVAESLEQHFEKKNFPSL